METVYILEGSLNKRKRLLTKLKESLADYELFVFDKNDHYDYVSQIVTEISCFAKQRLFIIKELPQIKIKSKNKKSSATSNKKSQMRTKVLNNFKKLFSSIPAGNVILFDNIGISSAPFLKEVEKYGRVFKYPQNITKYDARKIISTYFKKTKIDLPEEIIVIASDVLNLSSDEVNVDKLDLFLIKLHNYASSKSSVTKSDIFAICATSKDFIIWNLYNILDKSVEDREYSNAFKIVIDFLMNTKYFQHEATMLIQGMLWRYGLLLIAKSGINNKMSKQEIIDNISNIRKLKSEGRSQKIKMSPKEDKPEYSVKMINTVIERRYNKNILSYYTFDELIQIYYVISKSLVKIRSGCTTSEIITILQIIFLTICGKLKKNEVVDNILGHKKMLRKGA